jgi:predicted RNase H-like nuclease (RuvC/YqgF family)
MEQLTQAMSANKTLKKTVDALQRELLDTPAPQVRPEQREIDRLQSVNEKLRKDIEDIESQVRQLSAANTPVQTNCETLTRENKEIEVQACTGDLATLIERLTKELKQSYEEYEALALECGAISQ